ncbi:hypothetical protein PAXRUDRAFT_79318, partial [Paxillus rubicundulus Ve08.2h10]
EAFAMKTFINVHGRGFCRRKVLDEYFDNPKGTAFLPDEPMKWAKRKVKIPNYSMGEPERTLRNWLEEWRELQMVEEDLKGDNFFGLQIIMSNGVLNCIIDLAHGQKISDVTSLLAQTDWVYSELYGPKILDIIQATIPTPSLAQPP